MGMVEYIEPQCFKSGNIGYKKDKKSDIYSLGVLLWEISSGKPPFLDHSREMLAFHIIHYNLREGPIEGTPLKYQKLYQKCWESEPKSRPDIEVVYDILYPNISINGKSYSEIDNADLFIPSESNLPNIKLKPRNLLIIGHSGSGKSTLSNVLSNTVDSLESKYSKNFRTQIFEWAGTKYRVFDDTGMGNIILSIKEVLMPEGISQVLLVIDGKLEESTFNLLEDSIFGNHIAEYITIVRTKFSNFKNERECNKDNLCKKNETITKLCKSIVHIDNPPIDIFECDKDDRETITINKRRRDQSRTILLDHLNKVIPEKYYKNWDKLFYVGSIFVQPNSASSSTGIKSEKSNFNNLEVGIRNLIIVGRTNSGKSTLAEVLSGSHYDEESANKKYNVIDAGVTKSIKNIIKLSGEIKKICQILFVIDGKFMADEVKAILDNDIHEHITIVRTKFSNFKNEDKCKKDKEDLCKQNEAVAKICQNIVYVDNPPIKINVKDGNDKATIILNKKRRDWSRNILLDHLNKVFQEKCDEICNKIAIEELETSLQSEIPKVTGHDNYILKFLTNVTKNLTKIFT
ncbi:hypothetical protein RhiirA4_144121 [Rhizophagus irregularis]|uniref:Protein kinase domain-containing protein n=1 Tax=Rhizophagus irregularis TaxID=588596 RepID=A0A2I1GCJ3_9GLOM|nr:hypothetical protein RhiirA4_144121 [Rhizophagus irregularis]